jgi:prefoldin subunit 5
MPGVDNVPDIMDTIKCLLKGLHESHKSKYNEPKDIGERLGKNQNSIIQYIMFYLNLECAGMPRENESECKIESSADKWNKLMRYNKPSRDVGIKRDNDYNINKDKVAAAVKTFEKDDFPFPTDLPELNGLYGGAITPGTEKAIFSCLIQAILEKSFKEGDTIIHKGRQIVRLSDSKELVLRLVSPLLANAMSSFNSKGEVSDAVFWTAVGNTYKHVLPHKRDLYCDALGLSADEYVKIFEKWDQQVEKIRDKLASVGKNANPVIPDKNIIAPTVYSPNSTETKYRDSKTVLTSKPVLTLTGRVLRPTAPIMVKVTTSEPRVFAGGNAQANLHAPLYPTIVMNGGAHPLATLSGGDHKYVGTLAQGPALDRLVEQFKKLAGKDVKTNATVAEIENFRNKVVKDSEELQKNIDILQNANIALARAPLGAGFDAANFSAEQLKNLAKKGEEINKSSERLFKRMNKLDDIADLLQQVVDRHTPVVDLA